MSTDGRIILHMEGRLRSRWLLFRSRKARRSEAAAMREAWKPENMARDIQAMRERLARDGWDG